MREKLLELLDCPVCRAGGGLEAHVLERRQGAELEEAVLTCGSCGRWFPVSGGVPDLVVDGLRDADADIAFLQRHAANLPAGLADSAPPVNLANPTIRRTPDQQRVFDEGVHWGAYMKHFWDVGDRSIFDVRKRGSHPSYYMAGILEPDERDTDREYGVFPNHVSRVLFPWLREHAGTWGIDVGCGGGQYGLEAARQGVRMVGCDPSMMELRLGLQHARDENVEIDYVRAEPEHPPFKPAVFDLMLAKDSLHHVPNLAAVFPTLLALLGPGAGFGCYEHIGASPLKRRVLEKISPPLVRKIKRRYPSVEIPPDLLRDSANEDVSMDQVRPAIRQHFRRLDEHGELRLYFDIEQLVHYAYGKRLWFTWLVGSTAYLIERLLLNPFQPIEHWAFHGRLKDNES
ncbi:methyltransferase domain-containing protein [bacterium]|nr:methyltransferase domain-containing protein [bacterium]